MTFRKPDQKRLILGLLHQREVSGYDVYKFLAKKGARIWPNHVYGTLSEMERAGLLKGRWLDNPGGKGPRKHLYSLSIRGKKEFRELIRESIDLLVGEYSRSDHTKEDVRNYLDVVKSYFGRFTQIGARIPTRTGSKIVGVVPDPDPLVCSPLYIEAASEALPNAALYVVKPPHAKLDLEVRPNLTVLDGWRHNMPLKDGFADWLSVQGFPKEVSEEETILECARVLKDDGQLLILVSNVMTEEKKPRYTNFAEFALKLLYDLSDSDRVISVSHVQQTLSEWFREVNNIQDNDMVIFHATGKLQQRISGRLAIQAKKPQYSHVR